MALNDFNVLEVETGYVTPCHIPLSMYGRPFALDQDGYSTMARKDGGKRVWRRAHRVRYEAIFGPLPEGLVPDHLCKHRPCCNPAHMEAVTAAENVRRGSVAKLDMAKAIEMRAMRAAGMKVYLIAERFGVSQSVASRAIRGENWAEGTAPAWDVVKARRAAARDVR
jgi:hypothetical protein